MARSGCLTPLGSRVLGETFASTELVGRDRTNALLVVFSGPASNWF